MFLVLVIFLASLAGLIYGIVEEIKWINYRKKIIKIQREPNDLEDWINRSNPLLIVMFLISAYIWGHILFVAF
jgi:hypothetical protein